VNTASIAGVLSGVAYIGPYAVSKVGVVSLSETLRQELQMAGSQVGICVLCPSATNTAVMEAERNRPAALGGEQRTPDAEGMRLAIRSQFTGPEGKEPEEVAALVLDAIREDRFWVITHGELRPIVEARYAEMLDAMPKD
jgi:NAD(P)-dependent dehydrogenase (short-subunit alcohol dehydrogenase family)